MWTECLCVHWPLLRMKLNWSLKCSYGKVRSTVRHTFSCIFWSIPTFRQSSESIFRCRWHEHFISPVVVSCMHSKYKQWRDSYGSSSCGNAVCQHGYQILNLFNDDTGFQVTPNATVRSCAFLMTLKCFRNDSKDARLILKHWFALPLGTGGMTFLRTWK